MAPREPYKVHSLNKHIEETKKGISAEAQSKSRSLQRAAVATVKKEPASAIFGNDDESSDSSVDSSSSSSGDERGKSLLDNVIATAGRPAATPKKTTATTKSPAASAVKGRSKPEEIADSDVERSAAAKKSPAAPAKKATSSSSSTSSEEEETSSETSSESESEEKKKKKPKAKANANGVKAKASAAAAFIKDEASEGSSEEESSSEEDEDSDDEEESESSDDKETQKPAAKQPAAAATKKATPANKDAGKKTATKKTQSSSSSDEESSEEESSEAPAKVAKPRPKTLSEAKVVESASSESEGSDDEGNNTRVDESMHMSDREGDHQQVAAAAAAAAAMPSLMGSDFVLRKGGEGANGQDVAKILNEANLQGKQFWYFTIPSNVPISVVQNLELPMDRAQSGDRIFSHDGQDFGISFDSIAPKTSIQILIPSGTSSEYRATPRPIDQAMHVKRITQLGGAASSTAGPSPGRAPRPQPQGLRARYQPFGVSSPMGEIGEDAASEEAAKDVDMAEASAAASTATPASKAAAVNGKKKPQQKQPSAAEAKTPDAAGRKGKRKHTGSEEDAAAAAEQLKGEIQSAAKKQKKQKGRAGSPDLGSEPPSAMKAQTAISPPTIPQSTYSFASLDSAKAVSTPPPKSASSAAAVTETAKKSAKKVKVETPQPTSSQAPTTAGNKQTPIPLPGRHSVVPLPVMLSSASKQAREASAPVTAAPVTPSQNKGKRSANKGKDAEPETIPSSQQEPPPSTQPVEKAKKTSTKGKAQPV